MTSSLQGWTPSQSRRRPKPGQRTYVIGAFLVASAATLGYIIGRCSINAFNSKHNASSKYYKYNNKSNANHFSSFIKKRNILIFGDSTTWGYSPDHKRRLVDYERYPFLLQQMLGNEAFNVIAEGLNGRTVNRDDIEHNVKNQRRQLTMNGLQHILPILYSHKPLNMVILMLGINDCKAHFNNSASKIANAMEQLIIKCINAEIWLPLPAESNASASDPLILLLAPATMNLLTPDNKEWDFDENSINISHAIANEYRLLTMKYKCVHFVDTNEFIETGSDSIHLSGENNIKLAQALTPVITHLFENNDNNNNNNNNTSNTNKHTLLPNRISMPSRSSNSTQKRSNHLRLNNNSHSGYASSNSNPNSLQSGSGSHTNSHSNIVSDSSSANNNSSNSNDNDNNTGAVLMHPSTPLPLTSSEMNTAPSRHGSRQGLDIVGNKIAISGKDFAHEEEPRSRKNRNNSVIIHESSDDDVSELSAADADENSQTLEMREEL